MGWRRGLAVGGRSGTLHPLLKVRAEFRAILMEMGFSEMPTNNFVESSFWNFDTLCVAQQHAARDLQDTFFLDAPAKCNAMPEDYKKAVQQMHEKGGYGSIGCAPSAKPPHVMAVADCCV